MTLVFNDPSWWPLIGSYRIGSYVVVAASAGVLYDWALTFTQEVELVWRHRWSSMTVMYLGARYLGISYSVINALLYLPTVSVTDVGCHIMYVVLAWMGVVVGAVLGVIIIIRLHAMYSQSTKVLIFLIAIFLAINVPNGWITARITMHSPGEELILSGTHHCNIVFDSYDQLLVAVTWVLTTVWETIALCFAGWIAVKHFRELQQSPKWVMRDCFTVLIKTHVLYFASFVATSSFHLSYLSPTISTSIGSQIYPCQIFSLVHMFVLGPRLILGVREHHAKLVAESDMGTTMTLPAFQERVQVSTCSSV